MTGPWAVDRARAPARSGESIISRSGESAIARRWGDTSGAATKPGSRRTRLWPSASAGRVLLLAGGSSSYRLWIKGQRESVLNRVVFLAPPRMLGIRPSGNFGLLKGRMIRGSKSLSRPSSLCPQTYSTFTSVGSFHRGAGTSPHGPRDYSIRIVEPLAWCGYSSLRDANL